MRTLGSVRVAGSVVHPSLKHDIPFACLLRGLVVAQFDGGTTKVLASQWSVFVALQCVAEINSGLPLPFDDPSLELFS